MWPPEGPARLLFHDLVFLGGSGEQPDFPVLWIHFLILLLCIHPGQRPLLLHSLLDSSTSHFDLATIFNPLLKSSLSQPHVHTPLGAISCNAGVLQLCKGKWAGWCAVLLRGARNDCLCSQGGLGPLRMSTLGCAVPGHWRSVIEGVVQSTQQGYGLTPQAETQALRSPPLHPPGCCRVEVSGHQVCRGQYIHSIFTHASLNRLQHVVPNRAPLHRHRAIKVVPTAFLSIRAAAQGAVPSRQGAFPLLYGADLPAYLCYQGRGWGHGG